MSVQHFNMLKENQIVIYFLMPAFICLENKRNLLSLLVKNRKNLVQETNTAESLLANLEYQPLLSFTV